MQKQFHYLVIEDAKRLQGIYKLETWEIETFIRLVRDAPSDGFAFVFERIVSDRVPADGNCLSYSMNDPTTLEELESRWNLKK